jgi:hypothetical protein
MKKIICTLIAYTFLAATAIYAMPQQSSTVGTATANEATSLRRRLALTADQQAQLRTINRERKAQLDDVTNDTSLSPSARIQKTRAIRAGAETKIRAMLSENQLAEYDQIKRERRERAIRNRQTTLPPQ